MEGGRVVDSSCYKYVRKLLDIHNGCSSSANHQLVYYTSLVQSVLANLITVIIIKFLSGIIHYYCYCSQESMSVLLCTSVCVLECECYQPWYHWYEVHVL